MNYNKTFSEREVPFNWLEAKAEIQNKTSTLLEVRDDDETENPLAVKSQEKDREQSQKLAILLDDKSEQ